MSIAICFIIIVSIAAVIADMLKNKIDITIPISVMSIVLIIYPFGFFQKLSIGVWIVCAISVIAICYLIVKLILSIKNKNFKEFAIRLFTPGIVVYFVLWVIFTLINKWRMLSVWDEFSHWGLVVKNMFIFDSYATNLETIVIFREYPPFTAIFEYFFLRIKNYYLEGEIIIAMNVLYSSILLPVFNKIDWNKNILKILIYLPIIFVLPLCMYSNFYTTIYVDPILGIMMAYILYTYFNADDDIVKYISICVGLISLPLIKAAGSGLAIFTLLIIFVDIFIERKPYSHNKKQLKKYLIIFLIFIACFIIGKYSWDVHLEVNNTSKTWNTSIITLDNIIKLIKGQGQEYQYIVIKNFINQFIYEPININIGRLTNLHLLLIYVIYSFYMLSCYKKTDNKIYQRYKKSIFMIILCYLLYLISLIVLYIFIYTEYEAVRLASYTRYSFVFLLGMFTFNMLCIMNYILKYKTKKSEIIILLIVLCLITPYNIIKDLLINNPKNIQTTIETRKQYEGISNYINKLSEGDKVYYISCGSKGFDSHVSRYEMVSAKIEVDSRPGDYAWSLGVPRFEGDIWSIDVKPQEFADKLINNNYKYVYVYKYVYDDVDLLMYH